MRAPQKFDYHYFDDPQACGYQGYYRKPYGDNSYEPWEEVVEYCVKAEMCSAIDLGCAKGFLVEALLEKGIKAKGYDVSDYALSFALTLPCEKHDIRFGVPGAADVIIALGLLMYLSERDLDNALKSISRAANKAFLFSCHYEENVQMLPDSLRQITKPRSWWREEIQRVGFEHTQAKYYFDVFVKSHELSPNGCSL